MSVLVTGGAGYIGAQTVRGSAAAGRCRSRPGWKPTRGLDEIVGSAWAWHGAHPDGYGVS